MVQIIFILFHCQRCLCVYQSKKQAIKTMHLFIPPGPGWLLLRGEYGGQHCVCIWECDPVPALQPGRAHEHQCLQCAARWGSCRVHQELAAKVPWLAKSSFSLPALTQFWFFFFFSQTHCHNFAVIHVASHSLLLLNYLWLVFILVSISLLFILSCFSLASPGPIPCREYKGHATIGCNAKLILLST